MRKCGRMRKSKKKNWHAIDNCGHFYFGYDGRCKRIDE
jgi:hypothetical protein